MAKNKLCSECVHNNNGWCNKLKTNKGLKDLIECTHKQTEETTDLNSILALKKKELEVDNSSFNRGIIKGLELAINVLNNK